MGFGEIDFSAYSLPDQPGLNFWGASGGHVVYSYAYINSDYAWSGILPNGTSMYEYPDYCPYTCDYATVMVHEIGHAVALDHGGCSSSVMCVNVVKTTLSSHDVSSLQSVY
jgi:hypothetical protein